MMLDFKPFGWKHFLFLGLLILLPCVAHSQRPNVVLVLIDDLSHYGVTAYGADRVEGKFEDLRTPLIQTPRIDRLAESGLMCEYAYAYPLCEATRIALMSGQYNARNFLKPKSQHASDITFGDLFQRAGYATGIFGKWKQTRGTQQIPGEQYLYEFGWDEFACFDVTTEGRRFIYPHLVVNGEVHNYDGRDDLDPETGRRWYGPDIINRHALDFIDRHRDESFFLYYPMMLVHDEHTPTPDTQPAALFDEFAYDKPNKNGHMKGDDRRYFPDMVAYMDKLIGNVGDRLDKLGIRENTLVIVMGDNGTKETFIHLLPDGSTYRGGKGGTRENGLRVPLVLNQAGVIEGGGVYSGMVDVVDILPTICEAAGIDIGDLRGIDGVSFWPQATGADGEARDAIYTWYNANFFADNTEKLLRYAFDKDFKRYAPHIKYSEGRFFDLRTDPLENGGDRREHVIYDHYHASGLNLPSLTPERRVAYERLGQVIEGHAYVPVKGLALAATHRSLPAGGSMPLAVEVLPADATRQNVIFETSDRFVATVDKFGVVTAHAPGEVTITVYSWDDAWPMADKRAETYRRNGVQDSIKIKVTD